MVLVRLALLVALCGFAVPPAHARPPHNVVIFVADGLRYSSVTPDIAPTLWKVRHDGVDFTNSHSLFPTVTTANASAIATGHYLGDTGDYGNTLWFDRPIAAKGGTKLTFLEDDAVLAEVKSLFGDNYLGQTSLLAAARAANMNTAVIGKLGPAAIQDIDSLDGKTGIIIDDATNRARNPDGTLTGNVPLPQGFVATTSLATGLEQPPMSAVPNYVQQSYLLTAATQVVLPHLKEQKKPFVLVFWSRDPDGTQHGQSDREGNLTPGINGPTGRAGVANADDNLKVLLQTLSALGLNSSTDVFVTSDHGFSTIAHGLPTADGGMETSSMPCGFLAVDISRWLAQPIFDPDADNSKLDLESGAHPSRCSGLIGPTAAEPQAVVAANGGADLIYVPGPQRRTRAKLIFDNLLRAPYTGALFVNDELLADAAGDFAGALPMSSVNLIGASQVPQPTIVLGLRSWVSKECKLARELCAAEIADSGLHTGQGMHGSFSRADTRNFMAAIGPDFRRGFADPTPVSNADIAPTIAHILGVRLEGLGALTGRVVLESLRTGKPVPFRRKTLVSAPAPGGLRTVLEYEEADGRRYFDTAGIPGRTVGLTAN